MAENYLFSNSELVDMVLMYGEARQNSRLAADMYAERFPQRRHPDRRTFINLVQRARDTANLQPQRGREGGPGRPLRVLNQENRILNVIEDDPYISTRRIAQMPNINVSHYVVWRTIREAQAHPYHIQRVQALSPQDFPIRLEFCEWLLAKHRRNPTFTKDILVCDESCFTRNGIMNFRNMHYWHIENPHAIRRTNFQQTFSVNVWAGLVNNMLIGPFVLPNRLNGANYLNFLRNDLPILLEDVPLDVRQRMWFLHDGCPAHFSLQVRNHLNHVFGNKWIGRGGPVAWPPRSPDLTPLDFFLWGYMKSLVYVDNQQEIETVENLQNRIELAAAHIRGQQIVLNNVNASWIRRAEKCIECRGGQFQHLL